MKLTQRRIDELTAEPGKRDRLVFDDEQGGLAVRVTENGSKSYLLQFSFAGQRERMGLGNCRSVSLADARKAAAGHLGQVALGINPKETLRAVAEAAKVQKQKRDISLGKLIETWANKHLVSKSLNYRREAVRAIRRAFNDDLNRPAIALTKSRVIAVLDEAPAFMARLTAIYGAALFSWAVDREMVPANPFDRAKVGRTTIQRDRVLTDDELRAIWRAAAQMGRYGAAIQMLMLTGQRRLEVAEMPWIEVQGDLWTIQACRSKNNKDHILPLPAAAQNLIDAQPRISDLVFGRLQNWSRDKAALDAASGVSNWRLHDLRRTVATGLQRLGVRLETTEAILNHTSGTRGGIVGIYQRHDWLFEKGAALNAWAAHLESIVNGEVVPDNVVALRA
jgi:integrase